MNRLGVLALSGVTIGLIGLAVYPLRSQNGFTTIKSGQHLPNPLVPGQPVADFVRGLPEPHVNNPSPLLPNNDTLPTSAFISKEEAIGTPRLGVTVESSDLMRWSEFVNRILDNKAIFTRVAPNRMVYVIIKKVPGELVTRAGTFSNATRITVIDAETGKMIMLQTSGDSFNPASRFIE